MVGGDKETIMRLVLLIAAHYRPDQIQRQSHQNQSHVVTSNAQSGTSTPANFMIDPTSNQIFAQVTDINHQKFSAPDYQVSFSLLTRMASCEKIRLHLLLQTSVGLISRIIGNETHLKYDNNSCKKRSEKENLIRKKNIRVGFLICFNDFSKNFTLSTLEA